MSVIVAAVVTICLAGHAHAKRLYLSCRFDQPVLYDLGLPTLPAQFFLFYFAVMSALTPPVAVAAYAASAIANCNPLEIAVNAVKISIGAFVVPFAFLFNNALLLDGSPLDIAVSFCFACLVGVTSYCCEAHMFSF